MSNRQNKNQGSWGELILFVLIILCAYFILALFDSSFTGDSGREWGKYLRTAWGGAVIVPLLFVFYLCIANLLKFRVPRIPRQILGTIQLYISFAFMLGLLRETGWSSDWTLSLPGNFGQGIARFFVLNVGTFITLLLVICSFLLSAFFFGSRLLKLSLPSFGRIYRQAGRNYRKKDANDNDNYEELLQKTRRGKRQKPKRERTSKPEPAPKPYPEHRPENILFMKDIPAPTLKPAPGDEYYDDYDDDSAQLSNIQMPKLKPAPEDTEYDQENEPPESEAIEKINNLIAMLDSGALTYPEKKRAKNSGRPKKFRRPLPTVSFPEEFQDIDDNSIDTAEFDEPVFPPPMEIFGSPINFEISRDTQKISDKQAKIITSTLKNFNVVATVANIITGPSVIQYLLELAPGMKVNKVSGLADDLAMALAVMSVRIEAPIPGTHYVGIEVPNPERKVISLRNILESEEFQSSNAHLPLPLGVQVDGKYFVQGLDEMPHLLIAGNNGSGKNTFINTCILSMCSKRRPEELRLVLIDPRHVEFAIYDGLPHLLSSPVSNPEQALRAMQWAYSEMETRAESFAKFRVRNLTAYNRKLPKKDRLPEIVIIIDELADLMYSLGNEIEDLIVRLAQKSGSVGIYMMLAAQRPSADVLTSLIRTNIPARVAFTLTSQNDSKNIIGVTDADKLTSKGDMLFRNTETPQIFRLQAPFISEEKVAEFVEYMGSNLDAINMIKF